LGQADIVVESARPRALEQLGFDAATWVEARPGRVWASITGYGRSGPERNWIAFGDDAAVAAGLIGPPLRAVDGGAPGPAPGRDPDALDPCFCADAIADPLTGLHAAVAVLAHWRAGRGGLLDLSLVGVAARSASLAAESPPPVFEIAGGRWCVDFDGRAIAVASPRARSSAAEAPALAAPSATLWAEGEARC
jgi:crotonobetainyl-CoA:carnitine CoA-transferase CaiB-like acyl-CoA transferase